MIGFRAISVVLFLMFMAPTVSANEVTFSGDARVRYIYRDNYGFGNFDRGAHDVLDSRVRINLHAKSKGGAYAKARIRLADQDWGLDKDRKSSDTFWVDIAYLGIPIGPTVVEGGLLKSNVTRFFEWDQSADQIQLMWDMFGAEWTALFRMADENIPAAAQFLANASYKGLAAYGKLKRKRTGKLSFIANSRPPVVPRAAVRAIYQHFNSVVAPAHNPYAAC